MISLLAHLHCALLFGVMVASQTHSAYAQDPSSHSVHRLQRYTTPMSTALDSVLAGAPFADAFPLPFQAPAPDIEQGFRAAIARVQPVRATVAATTLQWIFWVRDVPDIIVEVVILPTAPNPSIFRLQVLWRRTNPSDTPASQVALSKSPAQWTGVLGDLMASLHPISAQLHTPACTPLVLATDDQIGQFFPQEYRQDSRRTRDQTEQVWRDLCGQAKRWDLETWLPIHQHFNLINPVGTVIGGVVLDFDHPSSQSVLKHPRFKQLPPPK